MVRSFRVLVASLSRVLRPSCTLLFGACLGALFVVGAGSAAQTQRGYFDVRVRGEITKRWSYVQNNPQTECEVRRTYRGTETFTFRSRRLTRVLVRSGPDGRLVVGALLRGISGTYLQAGGRADRSMAADCAKPIAYGTRCSPPRKSANRGGTVSVAAPRRGVVELRKLRLQMRLARALSACEPREVAALPTRVEVASARAVAKDVFDANARVVELDAAARETTTFSGGDSGTATVNVTWTVSFEPLG
jgi:hypothetical protein